LKNKVRNFSPQYQSNAVWHPTMDLLKKRKKEYSHFQQKEDFKLKKKEKQRDLIFSAYKHTRNIYIP
jgi:hypothetical protein